MLAFRPRSGPYRRAALAAAATILLGGCLLPSRFVGKRAPPPADVARELAREAAAPLPPAAPPAPAAAPAPPAPPRSLADLVDLALSRDPATRAAWHDARAAAAQSGARRSAYLPSLDASASLARQRPAGGGQVRTPFTTETATGSAAITWLLLDLGARSALVDEGDRLLAAARLAEHAAVADLVLRVEEAYFGYLASRALVEAQAATVAQAETSLASAEGRQRAGLATVADVLQARTALSQTRLVLQQLEGQSLAARGGLATLAGLPPHADLDVGALPPEVDAAAAQPPMEELLARAAARNPDVARAHAGAEAAEARMRAASRAIYPTLSLQAGASRSYVFWSSDPTVERDAFGSTGWNLGLTLRLPLLDGLGLRAAYDALAARASADAARSRADATEQRVALDVWTSFLGVRTAGQRIGTSRDLLASARASSEVARGRYAEGVGSIVDLLNAQAALELARAEDVRARADFLVALARLARASGRLDLGPEPSSQGTRAP